VQGLGGSGAVREMLIIRWSRAGVHKSRAPDRPDDYILSCSTYVWVLRTELASCQPPGAQTFAVVAVHFENYELLN